MISCEIIIPLGGEAKRLVTRRVLPYVALGAYLILDVWGTLHRWKIEVIEIYANHVLVITDPMHASTVKFFKDEQFKSLSSDWNIVEN